MPDVRFCPCCATPLALRDDGGTERPACPDAACGYVHYDNPTPVVAAIVEIEGDVLLVQSRGWPDDWFALVAGFLERDESPEEGVLREIREETGLDGTVVGLVGNYAFPMRNQLLMVYHVRAAGTLVLSDELAAYRRVPPGAVRPWSRGTGPAVRDWLVRQGIDPLPTIPLPTSS